MRTTHRAVARLAVWLLAVPLALGFVVLDSEPAHACSCAKRSFAKQLKSADTVFLGRVRETAEVDEGLEFLVLAQRLYKGDLDQPLVQVTTPGSSAACGVGEIPSGERYLFLTTDGTTTICHGTRRANEQVTNRVQRRLGLGTVIQPPRPEAAFDRVEDSPPPDLQRLLAPGGAAVLVGLLGLLVVRRLAR